MMIRWVVTLLVFFMVVPPLSAVAADELEEALRDLPPQQRTMYRRQLLQLDRVARRLLHGIPQPPEVNFILAAGEPSVNAGTTFGKVIVSEGMMRFVRSDDELAMILGHELAHQTQGHVASGARNNVLLNLGSIIAGSFIPGGAQAAGLVGQLFLNHFNQDQEREADQIGLQYVYDAGYNPQVAARVMQRMAEEVPETTTSGFFSSHPSSAERFEALQRQAAALSPEHEMRRAASAAPGPRPRLKRDEKACKQASSYFYRAKEAGDSEQKIALYQRGLRTCPQSPRAHAELAEVYADLGEEREALEEFREALRYDPNYPSVRARLHELEDRVSHATY
jgi:predicted Zn-dependent protease